MVLIAAKKIIIPSALAVGGSVVYGFESEDIRSLAKDKVPGYEYARGVYEKLKGAITSRFWKQSSPPSSQGADLQVVESKISAEIEKKYGGQISALREELQNTQDRLYRAEMLFKEELDASVEALVKETKGQLQEKFQVLFEEEVLKLRAEQVNIDGKILELANDFQLLENEVQRQRKAGAEIAIIDQLNLMLESSSCEIEKSKLLGSLALLSARSTDEFIKQICESMKRAIEQFPRSTLSHERLVQEADSIQQYLRQSRSLLSGIILRGLGITLINPEIESTLDDMKDQLDRRDYQGALKAANQISGWGRVFLKDWIVQMRRLAELQSSFKIMRYHLLATKLAH